MWTFVRFNEIKNNEATGDVYEHICTLKPFLYISHASNNLNFNRIDGSLNLNESNGPLKCVRVNSSIKA